MSDYRLTAAPIIKEFLNYHEVIKNHSANTIDAYYLDVKKFIYFLKMRANEPTDSEMIDVDTLGAVTKTDIYDYVTWLRRDQNLDTSTRQRRLAAIHSLYSYLTVKKDYLKENPTVGIDNPNQMKDYLAYRKEITAKPGHENALFCPSAIRVLLHGEYRKWSIHSSKPMNLSSS